MAIPTDETRPVTLVRRERTLRPDMILIIPYLVLSALGLVMIYSASAPRLEDLGLSPTRDLERQAIFVIVGFVAFALTSIIDLRSVRRWVPAIYLGSVFTLILVLSPLGANVKGAQRWIPVGPYQFQPSEIAKVAVVLGLAALLSAAAKPMHWGRVARAVALVVVPSLLIFFQPDLGTMLTFGFIAIVMIFVAGATFRQMGALVLGAIVAAVGVFQVGAVQEYQLVRLTAFLDSAVDPLGPGYNQLQSEIAIGTGGLLGRGLFNGTQTNLRFVPEQSSDFIFTALGEQLGFIGSAFVLVLFGVIVWRILMAAVNARDRFGQLVAIGVAALISFHVFVNVGMTIRLMPVTGLPLPFMSAGGTVFVAMSVALGLVNSVWLHRAPARGEGAVD
jgi:rod shape determining protein RodA